MTLHKLTVLAILAHAALSNPITRRHHGIQHIPMNTHLTFWRDRECSAMNGHLNVDISNREWHILPPGTAAVSMMMNSEPECNIYMCAAGSDCTDKERVLGPIAAEACNVGVTMEADSSMTVFGKVMVECNLCQE